MFVMPLKIERLDHLAIYVSDVERAERFYVDVLGMERVMRLPDQTLLKLGDVNFGLMQGRDLPPPDPSALRDPRGKAHHAFLVSVEEFARARAALAAASAPLSETVNWGDHDCFYFLDPDGNMLEIVTPPSRTS
jgi:catechol 2,3-dioxygenase-like lactoylglutathione lyase family enzyme